MLQDLQHASRTLRRRPLVALVAILTLAMGIGAATAVFSIVDAVLLQPLPFHEPDRLVRIHALTPQGDRFSLSDADYLDIRSELPAFSSVAAWRELAASRVLTTDAGPVRIDAVQMSASLPDALGVHPAIGHFFSSGDEAPPGARRIVLGHAAWQRYFAGDSDVIGRTVSLDDEPFVVTGVMPAGFDFPSAADAWVPLVADGGRDDKELAVVARLERGVDLARARADLRVLFDRLGEQHPEVYAGWSADAMLFDTWLVAPRFREAVWMLFGAVALLLLLVCVNIANILLAQATTRLGELRIRAALGASRLRLARQLFAESALLAVLGTAAGVLLAFWLVDAVRLLGGDRIPRLEGVEVHGGVLLFASLMGLVTCVAFGTAPAVRGARAALREGMDEGLRYSAGNRRARQVLVGAELALAVLLLVGATLLATSFARLISVDDGFEAAGAVAMPIELPAARYSDDQVAVFYATLLEQVRATPGVSSAGATSTDPFRQFGFSNNVTPEDRAHEAPPTGLVQAGWRSVTPGLFDALHVPLVAGRTFGPDDRPDTERVVVVSRSLANRLWPGQEAVGKRLFWGGTTGRTRTVVGVVGDVRDVRLDAEPPPMLYVPHLQVDLPAMTVIARTSLPPSALAPVLREAVRRLDPGLPPPDVHEVSSSRTDAAAPQRFNLMVVAAFATLALILAVTGVYGALAFTVAERRREIAVRLALGATPSGVARLMLATGIGAAMIGIAVGLAGAAIVVQLLESLLFGIAPRDPLSFAAAATLLLVTAAAACYIPARRAAAVDPAIVLRD